MVCVCMHVLACTQVAYSTPRSKHRRGNVFIGNLKPWVTTAVLKQLMEKHGTLLDCRVLTGALITAVACRAVCRPHTDGTALLTLVCWLVAVGMCRCTWHVEGDRLCALRVHEKCNGRH